MKSRVRFHDKTGFTLFEVMVVLALFGVIAALSIGIGINTFRSQVFDSEVGTVTAFLQTARNRAMNNVFQSQHGVRVDAGEIVLYVDGGEEYAIPRNDTVEITEEDIVFEQLSGNADGNYSITIDAEYRDPVTITVNDNGRIDW